jgi:hypothetical protein
MALNIPTIAIMIIGRRGRVCFSVPRSRAIVAVVVVVVVADAIVYHGYVLKFLSVSTSLCKTTVL